FWDITATATNKKITFTNFEAALTHDNLIAGTIVGHDTTATGANLTSLTDDSMVDTLHRHSELSASDGAPNQSLILTAVGYVCIGALTAYPDIFGTHKFNVASTNNVGLQFSRWSDSTGGPILSLVKSRSNTIGTHAIVVAGDRLGSIAFGGSDGSNFDDTGQIFSEVETAGGGQITGTLSFQTRNTSGGRVVAMTITDDQEIGVGETVPDARLEISTGASEGKQAFTIDQNDADKAFIDFQGTSAANVANNITTWTAGNSIQGFTRQEINGTEYWMPYYDAPTS
ncbi:hypothetical protein LCGC14_2482960, partial [marine sediment metagenome]